ncbi:MAG: RnfH family protein [Dokdonella sp.]|uniref:RnfH family protein n=1 Tax=Dokdonella sp. TaxID=2291710 RepID=UPI0025BF7038|nr:RnfH family protein [Dokdonella sp.]MBX3699895.1 RnfH family protein [Dokdonella sp.]
MAAVDDILVEVAYAEPGRQFLRALRLPVGSTVAAALAASGVAEVCSIDPAHCAVGIWSRRVTLQSVLADGNRVELYRPLRIDPKEARRLRAQRRR